MQVTVYPPSVEGMVIIPDVEVLIAFEFMDPPPTDASPLETVYVHLIPLTVSVYVVAALAPKAIIKMTLLMQILNTLKAFIAISSLVMFDDGCKVMFFCYISQ